MTYPTYFEALDHEQLLRDYPIGDAFTGSSLSVPVGETYVGGLEEALEGFTPEERG